MQKLSDFLTIDDWKTIAEEIQKLELPAKYYFDGLRAKNQLKKLKNALLKLNFDLSEGYASTDQQTHNNDIGLANLLENICSMTAPINYEQASFYEKIHKLAAIGIRNISFTPDYFEQSNYYMSQERTSDGGIHIIKIYTDGEFNLDTLYSDEYVKEYEISNIKNANFILKYDLFYFQDKIKLRDSRAFIKSFDGNNFPAIREIKRAECPTFKVIKPNNNNSIFYKEEYKIITTDNIRHKIGYPSVTREQKYFYKKK